MKDEGILLDSNVVLNALSAASPWCESLLEDCLAGKRLGILTAVGAAEVNHRLMALEAKGRGLARANPAKILSSHPEKVMRLSDYQRWVQRLFSSALKFEPVLAQDHLTALEIQTRFGMMTNDSLLASVALRLDVAMASADKAFTRVKGLKVLAPPDS